MVHDSVQFEIDFVDGFVSEDEYCDALRADIDAAQIISDTNLVRGLRKGLNRKFTEADIANGGSVGHDLYDVAVRWLPTQTGARFDWLRDLAVKFSRGGGLTDRQAAGVLNCFV